MKSKWKITFVIISFIMCIFTIIMGYSQICELNETIENKEKEYNKTKYYNVDYIEYKSEYDEYVIRLEDGTIIMSDFEIEIMYDLTPTAKDGYLFGIDKDGKFILRIVYAQNYKTIEKIGDEL